MPKTISKEVLTTLEESTIEGDKLVLPQTLERSHYLAVNKVLDALGGKWNRKAKGHLFQGDAADVVDDAILTGTYTCLNSELQYFPTPDDVIDLMIPHVKKGTSVLEPSAGEGAIAKRLIGAGCTVTCCEQHEPFRKKLKAIDGVNLLKKTDFLDVDPVSIELDAIIANPPFTRQQDVKHVLHMLKFIDRKGTLVSVMSNGITFRKNKWTDELNEQLKGRNFRFEPLPDKSFKTSGTAVHTVLLIVTPK